MAFAAQNLRRTRDGERGSAPTASSNVDITNNGPNDFNVRAYPLNFGGEHDYGPLDLHTPPDRALRVAERIARGHLAHFSASSTQGQPIAPPDLRSVDVRRRRRS